MFTGRDITMTANTNTRPPRHNQFTTTTAEQRMETVRAVCKKKVQEMSSTVRRTKGCFFIWFLNISEL
jgi:hypothetical protein